MDEPRLERGSHVRAPGDVAPGINEMSAAHDAAPTADEIAERIELRDVKSDLVRGLRRPGLAGEDASSLVLRSPLACDFAQEAKETLLPRAQRAPVDRHTLVAVVEALALHAIVEKPPRGILADGRDEVVPGLVEVEMIVLVEEDRHGPIAGDFARLLDHRGNACGILHAVAVQQEEIGRADDILLRDDAATVAGADEEAPAVLGSFPDTVDEFMNALGLEKVVVVADVAFVVDLDEDVAITPLEEPIERVVHAALDRCLVLEPLILTEVKEPQNDDHAEFVRLVENALQPVHVVGTQTAVLPERGVVPGLLGGVALRTAALEVQGHAQQPVLPPGRHGRDELAGVALGVPLLRVGVRPQLHRLRIEVVENRLHHAAVEEQPLNVLAPPGSPLVSRLAIDPKLLTLNGDGRCSGWSV